MKRWIAMTGMAVALGTSGVWVAAGPAAANNPPVEGTCPMLTGHEHAPDGLPEQGIGHMLLACKRIGGVNP